MNNEANRTRLTLIQKIKDTDNASAWEDFVAVYKQMIINWATYMGCSQSMADDVFQESIISLLRNLNDFEYSPSKGRFRGYLKTLVSRRVKDAFRRKKMIYENEYINDSENPGNYIDNIEDLHEPEEAKLDLMWITSLVSQALKNAKQKTDGKTYESFNLYAVQGCPVAEVCALLSIDKEGTVYQQKSRFIKLVSKELNILIQSWGDISFTDSKLNLDEPALLKCLTEIIQETSSIQQTILFQPGKSKLDARINFAGRQIHSSPLPENISEQPYILNTVDEPQRWVEIRSDKCTIGRISSATIPMPENGISSLHAVIFKNGHEWFIKDENSTNGTFLNGTKVTSSQVLKNGDIVHIAVHPLIFASN